MRLKDSPCSGAVSPSACSSTKDELRFMMCERSRASTRPSVLANKLWHVWCVSPTCPIHQLLFSCEQCSVRGAGCRRSGDSSHNKHSQLDGVMWCSSLLTALILRKAKPLVV
jgi:hypothetical protein